VGHWSSRPGSRGLPQDTDHPDPGARQLQSCPRTLVIQAWGAQQPWLLQDMVTWLSSASQGGMVSGDLDSGSGVATCSLCGAAPCLTSRSPSPVRRVISICALRNLAWVKQKQTAWRIRAGLTVVSVVSTPARQPSLSTSRGSWICRRLAE
jgi:hypothetical protein